MFIGHMSAFREMRFTSLPIFLLYYLFFIWAVEVPLYILDNNYLLQVFFQDKNQLILALSTFLWLLWLLNIK